MQKSESKIKDLKLKNEKLNLEMASILNKEKESNKKIDVLLNKCDVMTRKYRNFAIKCVNLTADKNKKEIEISNLTNKISLIKKMTNKDEIKNYSSSDICNMKIELEHYKVLILLHLFKRKKYSVLYSIFGKKIQSLETVYMYFAMFVLTKQYRLVYENALFVKKHLILRRAGRYIYKRYSLFLYEINFLSIRLVSFLFTMASFEAFGFRIFFCFLWFREAYLIKIF
ncbi:hypothetical protein MHBO_002716 [Bonamia ostreae]|uniref:Uncharacterized protein n=1 Tax=Bonamia ostreae TaxID=126728 RepID=A0ABV2AN94_9EUKA